MTHDAKEAEKDERTAKKAEALFAQGEANAKVKYDRLKKLEELYK